MVNPTGYLSYNYRYGTTALKQLTHQDHRGNKQESVQPFQSHDPHHRDEGIAHEAAKGSGLRRKKTGVPRAPSRLFFILKK